MVEFWRTRKNSLWVVISRHTWRLYKRPSWVQSEHVESRAGWPWRGPESGGQEEPCKLCWTRCFSKEQWKATKTGEQESSLSNFYVNRSSLLQKQWVSIRICKLFFFLQGQDNLLESYMPQGLSHNHWTLLLKWKNSHSKS